MESKLFEQVLQERDIRSILFGSKDWNKNRQAALNRLGLNRLRVAYGDNEVYVTYKNGEDGAFLRGDDGLYYKAEKVPYQKPIYKTIEVDNPDFHGWKNQDPDDYIPPTIKQETDEVLRYENSWRWEITDEVAPQEVLDFIKYEESAKKYCSSIKKQQSVTAAEKSKKFKNTIRVERIDGFDYEEFTGADGADSDYSDEVSGIFRLYFKNNFLGYVAGYGEYSFSYEEQQTYYHAATYWDPEESAGTYHVECTDGGLELSFWEKDATEDDLENGEGPMDLDAFLTLQHPVIRDAISKYTESAIEDELGFEAEYDGEWD